MPAQRTQNGSFAGVYLKPHTTRAMSLWKCQVEQKCLWKKRQSNDSLDAHVRKIRPEQLTVNQIHNLLLEKCRAAPHAQLEYLIG